MKEKMRQSLAAKIAAVSLLLIMVFVAMGSLVGTVFLMNFVDYSADGRDLVDLQAIVLQDRVAQDAHRALLYQREEKSESFAEQMAETNFRWKVETREGVLLFSNIPERTEAELSNYAFYYPEEIAGALEVSVYLEEGLPYADAYQQMARVLEGLVQNRVAVPVLLLVSVLVGLGCYVFLLAAVGHKKGVEGLACGPLFRVPLDILLVITVFVLFLLLSFAIEYSYFGDSALLFIVLACSAAALVGVSIFLAFSMQLALRLKCGRFWENTLLYRLGRTLLRLVRCIGRGIFRGLTSFCSVLPFVMKSVLFYFVLSVLALAALLSGSGVLFLLFLVLGLAVPYCAMLLHRLKGGIRALADGDLSHQLDRKGLFLDFDEAAQDINRVAEGMTQAVEERMKSERMKTELITNVSHDIKTPLTSIINYADLIAKEPCENETITQYSEVLLRQAERLKKLIEDLIEASKATSGSVEVNLAPCALHVLLSQAAGEYEKKLLERELFLVVKQPEAPVMLMADGRLLWRVFDNLLGNAYNYSLPGTRVYLSLEHSAGEILISFKNTSASPLDLPAEELMERFVRGDLSRNSEGNGLGLSIARSLVERQGGTLTLLTDGDLFKVVLRFTESIH